VVACAAGGRGRVGYPVGGRRVHDHHGAHGGQARRANALLVHQEGHQHGLRQVVQALREQRQQARRRHQARQAAVAAREAGRRVDLRARPRAPSHPARRCAARSARRGVAASDEGQARQRLIAAYLTLHAHTPNGNRRTRNAARHALHPMHCRAPARTRTRHSSSGAATAAMSRG